MLIEYYFPNRILDKEDISLLVGLKSPELLSTGLDTLHRLRKNILTACELDLNNVKNSGRMNAYQKCLEFNDRLYATSYPPVKWSRWRLILPTLRYRRVFNHIRTQFRKLLKKETHYLFVSDRKEDAFQLQEIIEKLKQSSHTGYNYFSCGSS